MENFTPFTAAIGGLLIGIAAIGLLRTAHKICGISGMVGGCIPPFTQETSWQLLFLLGLMSGGVVLHFIYPQAFEYTLPESIPLILFGGFLVGFGSRLGKGCTSGHGVCGIGRLASRSIVATAVFFLFGVLTATLMGVLF